MHMYTCIHISMLHPRLPWLHACLGQAQLLFLREALEDGRGIQKLQRLGLAA